MRSAIVISALAAFAIAIPAPAPQGLDFGAIDDTPPPTETAPPEGAITDPVDYNSASAAAAATSAVVEDPLKIKRSNIAARDCQRQPKSANPPPGANDTPENFVVDPVFSSVSSGAATPVGYTSSFAGLDASLNQAGYLGLYLLKEYDPLLCAAKCNAVAVCVGFDIYLERDPQYDPACDPSTGSDTNVKCTLYGLPVDAQFAKNKGQYRREYHVVIAASNGYNKNSATYPNIPGFQPPRQLPAAINAPLLAGKDTYMGAKTFTNAYDPSQCAAACTAQTAYNSRHPAPDGSYKKCTFFNTYVLLKNGGIQSQVCSLYTNSWDDSYAVNTGQTRGSDVYKVVFSVSYSLS